MSLQPGHTNIPHTFIVCDSVMQARGRDMGVLHVAFCGTLLGSSILHELMGKSVPTHVRHTLMHHLRHVKGTKRCEVRYISRQLLCVYRTYPSTLVLRSSPKEKRPGHTADPCQHIARTAPHVSCTFARTHDSAILYILGRINCR
jgi:hypothetical protein